MNRANDTDEELFEEEREIIGAPETTEAELENGIFTLIITLINHYMNIQGYSKETASALTSNLLEKYVIALREEN